MVRGAEIHRAFGAGPPTGTVQFTVFVPSVDRHGTPIDQERWREEALGVLASDTNLFKLRRFLHSLGREAQQGEVGIVVDGSYYGITAFDDGDA